MGLDSREGRGLINSGIGRNRVMSLIDRDRINDIRQANDIPVRELTNIGISRNRYYRYLNGENDLPAEGFFALMNHLLLTGHEINQELIDPHGTVEGLMSELNDAIANNDAPAMKEISRLSYAIFRSSMARGFLRVASLSDVMHARLVPDQHSDIALQILLDSFDAVTIWRELDIELLAPVLEYVEVERAIEYLDRLWRQNWHDSTMALLNNMTVRLLIALLADDTYDTSVVDHVADWLTNQNPDRMGQAWWRQLTSLLRANNWTEAKVLIAVAQQLGMTEHGTLGEMYLNAWRDRVDTW
jgi:hypothetical protein